MKKMALFAIRIYRAAISPLLGPNCRFAPTCSEYSMEAVEKYGVLSGAWFSLKRFAKCHPFHPGGFDPLK